MTPAELALSIIESSPIPTPHAPIHGIAMPGKERLAELAGELIIQSSGDHAGREGLQRTPQRYAKALDHLLSGYHVTPAEAVGEGVFQAEGHGLVTVSNIEFYSLCEHHLLPFWGTASVAYLPSGKILGLSKIPRLLEVFARRMQVQERLTQQLADAIRDLVQPRAVVVRIKAAHLCMMMRGVEKQNSHTTTEAFHGIDQLTAIEQNRIWTAL